MKSSYHGAKSYQRQLQVDVSASASGSYGLFSFAFTASTKFRKFAEWIIKPDTSIEGLVYSAVVVKDSKKTTVKTMATTQNEQTSSTSDTVQPVDVIEGMVYSAVIRQDGKKTSVKTTFLKDSSDTTTL